MSRLSMNSGRLNVIEILIVMYFSLGSLKRITFLEHADYILSLLIQTFLVFYLIKNKETKLRKSILNILFLNLFIIIGIVLYFFFIDIKMVNIIHRFLPLLSIFGVITVFIFSNIKIRFNRVLEVVLKVYFFIGCLVIIDALSFVIMGNSLWPPITYLGYRFSGPFYDSNYFGLFNGVMLLITLYSKNLNMKNKSKIVFVFIFMINLLIAGSWTCILFIPFAILLNKVLKFKYIFLKQIIFLFIYFFVLNISYYYVDEFRTFFTNIVEFVLGIDKSMGIAKFTSLEYRIDAQMTALNERRLMGSGPRSIVTNIGRDVHNSYVSFIFEMGILGFLLLLINFRQKISTRDKLLDILSTYIILMAFTLDVHYTVAFTLLLLLLEWNKINSNHNRSIQLN